MTDPISGEPDPALPPATAQAPAIAPAGGPEAIFYDGTTNRRRAVALRLGSTGVDIVDQGRRLASWGFATMRRLDGPPSRLRLSSTAAPPLARLEILDPALRETVAARCPALDADRGPRQTGRIVSWSLAAVASIVLVVMYGLPLVADRLAPLVPYSVEQRLGQAVERQAKAIFGDKECTAADGQAAFTAMVDKLKTAGKLAAPLRAGVVRTSLPNAFALPGGHIFVTEGLLRKANNPDEVAGVIAHELGHVQHRDSLRRIVQTGGTSFLLGLLFGDVTGGSAVIFASRTLFDASYSRDAERAADDYAIGTMQALGRSPQPMGELMFRITGAQRKKSLTILASHPVTEERLATMKAADRPVTGAPILDDAQWQALKRICGTTPAAPSPKAAPAASRPAGQTATAPAPAKGPVTIVRPGAATAGGAARPPGDHIEASGGAGPL